MHKHLTKVSSQYDRRQLLDDYGKKYKLVNGVRKLPQTALHLLHASHPKSPPIRARLPSAPRPKSSRSGRSATVDEKVRPEWNFDSKIIYSERPKSAHFTSKGELKDISMPGPLSLSNEANAYVNLNKRTDIQRPKSAHISGRTQYVKAFPIPHRNYPAPPEPVPTAEVIRETISKFRVVADYEKTRAVRPVSAPLHGRAEAPLTSIPTVNRPSTAARIIQDRFRLPITENMTTDASVNAPAKMQTLRPVSPAKGLAPHSSSSTQLRYEKRSDNPKDGASSFSDISAIDSSNAHIISSERVFATLRERYPPRRVVIQQCSVLPRLKFSNGSKPKINSRFSQPIGESMSNLNFDIRVVEVGVVCPLSDLPDSVVSKAKTEDEGISVMRTQRGEAIRTISTSSGILVEGELSTVPALSCSLFIPIRQLKNLASTYRRNDLLTMLKGIPVVDKRAGLYASIGEHLDAAEEGQLADLVLRATEIVYDPYSEKAMIVITQPNEEQIAAQLRQKPGTGKGVEGMGAKGHNYSSTVE